VLPPVDWLRLPYTAGTVFIERRLTAALAASFAVGVRVLTKSTSLDVHRWLTESGNLYSRLPSHSLAP